MMSHGRQFDVFGKIKKHCGSKLKWEEERSMNIRMVNENSMQNMRRLSHQFNEDNNSSQYNVQMNANAPQNHDNPQNNNNSTRIPFDKLFKHRSSSRLQNRQPLSSPVLDNKIKGIDNQIHFIDYKPQLHRTLFSDANSEKRPSYLQSLHKSSEQNVFACKYPGSALPQVNRSMHQIRDTSLDSSSTNIQMKKTGLLYDKQGQNQFNNSNIYLNSAPTHQQENQKIIFNTNAHCSLELQSNYRNSLDSINSVNKKVISNNNINSQSYEKIYFAQRNRDLNQKQIHPNINQNQIHPNINQNQIHPNINQNQRQIHPNISQNQRQIHRNLTQNQIHRNINSGRGWSSQNNLNISDQNMLPLQSGESISSSKMPVSAKLQDMSGINNYFALESMLSEKAQAKEDIFRQIILNNSKTSNYISTQNSVQNRSNQSIRNKSVQFLSQSNTNNLSRESNDLFKSYELIPDQRDAESTRIRKVLQSSSQMTINSQNTIFSTDGIHQKTLQNLDTLQEVENDYSPLKKVKNRRKIIQQEINSSPNTNSPVEEDQTQMKDGKNCLIHNKSNQINQGDKKALLLLNKFNLGKKVAQYIKKRKCQNDVLNLERLPNNQNNQNDQSTIQIKSDQNNTNIILPSNSIASSIDKKYHQSQVRIKSQLYML